MSKVILVMDKPERCDGCILHGSVIGRQICNAEIKRVKDVDGKPDWCPLKDVPEKKQYEVLPDTSPVKAWGNGWNACIDEIIKEGEGT